MVGRKLLGRHTENAGGSKVLGRVPGKQFTVRVHGTIMHQAQVAAAVYGLVLQ